MTDALNRAIRATFLGTAGDKLRLETTAMVQESSGRRLHFTGFHADGTPFAVESAPFTGSPIERAAQMAADVLTTHTGVPFMPAPAAIAGLATTLREALKAATDRANSVGARATSSVANLNGVLDTAEGVIKGVDAAAADVQAALGLNTNGGDPL
jgi:hypothetical protein